MTSPNAAKGKRWEKSVHDFFVEVLGRRGVQRPHQEGFADVGDHHVWPFVLQSKDEARHDFSGYLRAAELQRSRAELPYAAAVVKRRNASPADGYAVMTLATLRAVIARLNDAEDALLRADPYVHDLHMTEHAPPT